MRYHSTFRAATPPATISPSTAERKATTNERIHDNGSVLTLPWRHAPAARGPHRSEHRPDGCRRRRAGGAGASASGSGKLPARDARAPAHRLLPPEQLHLHGDTP